MSEWIWIILVLLILVLLLIVISVSWESFYSPNPYDFGSYNALGICIPNAETGYGCLNGRIQTFHPIPVSKPYVGVPNNVQPPIGSWVTCQFPEYLAPNPILIETNIPGQLFAERISQGNLSCQLANGLPTEEWVCGPEPPSQTIQQVKEFILGPQKAALNPKTNYPIGTCLSIGRVYLDLYPYNDIADQVKNRAGIVYQNGQMLSYPISGYPNPPTNSNQTVHLTWGTDLSQALLISLIPTGSGYKIVGLLARGVFGWITPGLIWVPWRWSTSLPGLVDCLTQMEAPSFPLIITSNENYFEIQKFPGSTDLSVELVLSFPFNQWTLNHHSDSSQIEQLIKYRLRIS